MGGVTVLVVIAYDIEDDRRRRRVARVLEGYGERVQESVFECWLDVAAMADLRDILEDIMDVTADRIRYYRLCGKDVNRVLYDGRGGAPREVAIYTV